MQNLILLCTYADYYAVMMRFFHEVKYVTKRALEHLTMDHHISRLPVKTQRVRKVNNSSVVVFLV